MKEASPYRPGREIAHGGMGAVLDARDQKLGRSVAMKVMLRPNASEAERLRFLQEAHVLGQLAHPNIVPIHDLGTEEKGRLFYIMKLVQGVTLHEVIGKLNAGDPETLAKYPLNTLLTVFQKVCDAVAFAHSRGIIHRDLKPQNIMVGEFGEVLVMDWGIAKILPGSPAGEEAGKSPSLLDHLGQTSFTSALASERGMAGKLGAKRNGQRCRRSCS
ncbi:MAG: serine/threonine-protein kinase [Limisphaerales bacterium]